MIEQIADVEDLAEVRSEWDRLYETSGADNLFLTANWVGNWLRWFSNNEHVVLLHRVGRQLQSVGVFCRRLKAYSHISTLHSHWPGILSAPSAKLLYGPYLDYMRADGKGLRILLNDTPDTGEFRAQLKEEISGRYYVICRDPHCTRSIEIMESMAAYLGTRPSDVRSELHRKRRKIERALPGVCLSVYDESSDIEEVFLKIADIERDSWKLNARTAIICSPDETGFYKGVLSFNEVNSRGRAFFLEHEGTPLAFVIGVVHGQRFYALKTSYKKQFSSLSPGQVLFYRLIEHFINGGGVREIELLGSDARWKQELATRERRLVNIELLEKSLSSAVYIFARRRVLPFLRNIVKKSPWNDAPSHEAKKPNNRLVNF